MAISIVIPTFNHRQFVSEAINSVQESLRIAGVDGEIIVIDDGSSDGTREVLKDKGGIKYQFQSNSGAHAAINRGIHISSNNLIAILNDDDIFLPHHLKNSLTRFKFSSVDLLLTKPLIFGSGDKVARMDFHMTVSEKLIERFGLMESLRMLNWSVSTSSFIFRKSVWQELNGFENYPMSHDWDFLLRASVTPGVRLARESRPGWKYRCHDSNSGDAMGIAEIDAEKAEIKRKHALPDWNLAAL